MSTATNEKQRAANAPSNGHWTATEASEHYDVARWGQGYFSVNESGHVQVHPSRDAARSIDLKKLVDRLDLRGLSAPILMRFPGILQHRLGEINAAFQQAIATNQYSGKYVCVYPIKVNQQRQVVQEVMQFGREYGFGLEAGSKPELMAVAAMARSTPNSSSS
jgi:arginine decarboxylase